MVKKRGWGRECVCVFSKPLIASAYLVFLTYFLSWGTIKLDTKICVGGWGFEEEYTVSISLQ